MSTAVGGRIIVDEVFTEGVSDQYLEVDLVDPSSGSAISTGAITAITGVLRSLDTEVAIFGGTSPEDLLAAPARASYPPATTGRVRVTFTAADMTASGSRELQTRELTLRIVHSGTKVFVCAIELRVRNLRDVG